jgi:hypothetical protein
VSKDLRDTFLAFLGSATSEVEYAQRTEPDKVGECVARDLQKSLFKLLGSAKQGYEKMLA